MPPFFEGSSESSSLLEAFASAVSNHKKKTSATNFVLHNVKVIHICSRILIPKLVLRPVTSTLNYHTLQTTPQAPLLLLHLVVYYASTQSPQLLHQPTKQQNNLPLPSSNLEIYKKQVHLLYPSSKPHYSSHKRPSTTPNTLPPSLPYKTLHTQ